MSAKPLEQPFTQRLVDCTTASPRGPVVTRDEADERRFLERLRAGVYGSGARLKLLMAASRCNILILLLRADFIATWKKRFLSGCCLSWPTHTRKVRSRAVT
jgi:hypothetical protein